MTALPWEFDDGGREAAGRRGRAGDCVVRAISIATGLGYPEVYVELHARAKIAEARFHPRSAGGRKVKAKLGSSPREGVFRSVYEPFLVGELGWRWTPTMVVGSGCHVHLAAGELPEVGPIIARVSRHVVAVVDGVIRDTHDPSRDGKRCVYGFYSPGENRLTIGSDPS